MKRIIIIVNDLGFFLSHRLPIAIAAKQAGYAVSVVFGSSGTACRRNLESYGFRLIYIPIQRGGHNPLADLASTILLWVLFIRLRPDLVHLVTIKPVIYGGIAARLARVPAVVTAIAGLGFFASEDKGLVGSLRRYLVKNLLRCALGHPVQSIIFQNAHDRHQVLSIAPISSQRTHLIYGSGVDLAACPYLPEPEGVPVVAMASRLLREKGVLEFVTAARLLRKRGVRARFWLIGQPDLANSGSVTHDELFEWKAEGVVECIGFSTDVPSLYAQSHIVTLPSFYGEGLPKSLIEAAACGRAVVTTDMPGCRDAIKPNSSGLLISPRNADALADALERLIHDTSLRQSMGRAGRALAEREFGIEKVTDSHLQIYRELLSSCES